MDMYNRGSERTKVKIQGENERGLDGERLRVLGEGGVELSCDQVIMAAPAFRAAEIVR